MLCFYFRSRYFSVTEKWFSYRDIAHRIEATPPGFKMTDHSRVGGTGGGTALLLRDPLHAKMQARKHHFSMRNGLLTEGHVNSGLFLFIGYHILLST